MAIATQHGILPTVHAWMPIFAAHDNTLPPSQGKWIVEFTHYDPTTHTTVTRKLDRFREIAVQWTKAPRTYVTDLPNLLAALWWHNLESGRELAYHLFEAVKSGQLIPTEVLIAVTVGMSRGFPALTRDLATVESAAVLGTYFEQFLKRPECANKGWGPLGIAGNVLAQAMGLILSWQGVKVNTELVEQQLPIGLDLIERNVATDLEKTVTREWRGILFSLRRDNSVHSIYRLADTLRLTSAFPNYTSFTAKPIGRLNVSARHAFISSPGNVLFSLDARSAEVFALAALLKDEGNPALAEFLAHEPDPFLHWGNQVFPARPDARGILKTGVYALLNLAKYPSLNEQLGGTLTEAEYHRLVAFFKTHIVGKYGITPWLEAAFKVRPTTPSYTNRLSTGHYIRVETGSQYVSRHTQTHYADAHHCGIRRLVERGFRPSLSVYDEVILDLPQTAIHEAQTLYTQGVEEFLGIQGLRVRAIIYAKHWDK